MKNFNKDQLVLGIIGAGTMGRGIAQIAAAKNIRVLWYDAVAEQVEDGKAFVFKMFSRMVEKEKISSEQCEESKACIEAVDSLEKLKTCDIVVEAIIENLEIKKDLFGKLEEIVSDECVLATNTSSIPISAIAADAKCPERFAGFHFFNPVPLMKIVEVIPGLKASPEVVENLIALGERMGHYAPKISDSPGFLVNHAGRGYATEALRIEAEKIAAPSDIDRILREIAGFRMGPFELLDLIGIDVTHSVMESIYELFYHEPKYKPGVLTRLYKDAKIHGRKTGKGFYEYGDDRKPLPVAEQEFSAGRKAAVWLNSIADEKIKNELSEILNRSGCSLDEREYPSSESICLISPVGVDATTFAVNNNLPPERTVAIDTIMGIKERICLMAPPVIDKELLDFLGSAFLKAGHKVTVINDSPGFVVQRVVAMIVNISCDIAQQGIAAPADINKAVKLGLGYPKGPLEFGDYIGADVVLSVLEAMSEFYGDPRYRPSPWLKRRALLGISLDTPQN